MIKYARIVDKKNGLVDVGLGTNIAFYQSIGMVEMDVEQGVDGQWYLMGYAPADDRKVIRTFAKDAIWVATKDMIIDPVSGITAWEAFKNFLLESGLWEGWTMQAYLLEENPFFAEFYPLAVSVFGKELVDGVLDKAVIESRTVWSE
jgi:hypothetical protein